MAGGGNTASGGMARGAGWLRNAVHRDHAVRRLRSQSWEP
jgi:hypothetical protein